MVEKVVLYLIKCTLFNAVCVYRTLTNKKVRYKYFLHEVARSWISEVQITAKSNSDDLQMPKWQTTPRGPKLDPPGRFFGDFKAHKLQKNCWWEGGGSPLRHRKVCAAHKKRIATRYICKFCIVPLYKGPWFEKYHTEDIVGYLQAVAAVLGSRS
jgi:hypothetical protein